MACSYSVDPSREQAVDRAVGADSLFTLIAGEILLATGIATLYHMTFMPGYEKLVLFSIETIYAVIFMSAREVLERS